MRSLLLSLLLMGVSSPASASIIAYWDFDDDDAVADTVDANASTTDFTAGVSLLSVTFVDDAAARGWNPSASAGAALANGDLWSFLVTADAGFLIDLTSLSFDQLRQTNGPISFQTYVAGVLVGSAGSAGTTSSNYSVGLTNTGLSSVLVQIVAWNAANNAANTSMWIVDNVTLNGSVYALPAAVPEPSSLSVLLGLGLIGFAGNRWRRRRQGTSAA